MPIAFAVLRLTDEFEAGRLLDRKLVRLCAIENFGHVIGHAPEARRDMGPVEMSPPSTTKFLNMKIAGKR